MKSRIAAALLCLLLPACAMAQDSDLYVFNYTGQPMEEYAFAQKYYHPSPHYNYLKVDLDGDGQNETHWNYTGHKTMNLMRKDWLSQGGEGAYASLPVYCLDAVTDGITGYAYRRINLEESGYFDTHTAGRLRAVLSAVFPYQADLKATENRVNEWLRQTDGSDFAPVAQLTESECVTAAQSAIWVLTNRVEIVHPYLGTEAYRFRKTDCIEPQLLDQPRTEYTAANCASLVRYLLALPAQPPADALISPDSFITTAAEFTQQPDGSWQATVTARIVANVHGQTRLTLRASCGQATCQPQPVADGEQTCVLTLRGIQDPSEPVVLTLEGIQDAADVFLFDPLGGRHQSQTMGGYVDCTAPVRVRMDVASSVFSEDPSSLPETGDAFPAMLMAVLAGTSLLGMTILRLRWKR